MGDTIDIDALKQKYREERDKRLRPDGNAHPPESVMTVELEDLGNERTLMRSRAEFASTAHRDQVLEMGMVEGLTESLDRLEEHLAA